MSEEKFEYHDKTFDIGSRNAIMHHCYLPAALREISIRVLKNDPSAYLNRDYRPSCIAEEFSFLTLMSLFW